MGSHRAHEDLISKGPEVGRVQARQKTREFTARGEGSGNCMEAAGRGESRRGAVQAQTVAGTHCEEVQISRTREKAQAGCDSLSNVAHKTVTTKTAHHKMSSTVA
jgi:hypothetical protein